MLFVYQRMLIEDREREKKKYLLDIRPIILIFSLLLLVLGVGAAAAVLGSSV